MANNVTYRGNLFNPSLKPLIMPGLFAAGSSVTVNQGDILELTGDSKKEWVGMNSVYDVGASSDWLAIAAEEVKATDLAGYYRIIVPRPGDIFEYKTDSQAYKIGDELQWKAVQELLKSSSNPIAKVVGYSNYPYPQNHLADGGVVDKGVAIRSFTSVLVVFKHSASFYSSFDDLNI